MKRPLLWAALLLTLGVLIINSRKESRDKWLLQKPSVRLGLEKSSSGYFPVSLTGTVLWAEEKNGRIVYKVDCGRKYGTVLVYEPSEEETTLEDRLILVGSVCRVSGTAFLYQPSENPGQFDVQAYYDDLGIYFGVSEAEVWTDKPKAYSIRRWLVKITTSFREVIQNTVDPEDADFLLLLSSGDVSGNGEELKKEASALSAVQLISMSGFIISSIGMLLYRLLRKLSADLFLCAAVPLILIVFYFFILGSPVSMLRAMIIFALRILAPVMKRRFDTLSAASLSVILLAVTRPAYLLLPAMPFYLAVLISQGIVCPEVQRTFMKRNVPASVLLSFFSLQASLLPVQILSRYSWSPYGMILVYFLLPLRTAAVILTLIGGFVGVFFGEGSYGLVRILLFLPGKMRLIYAMILSVFSGMPMSTVNCGKPADLKLLGYVFIAALAPAVLYVRSFLIKQKRLKDKRLNRHLIYLFPAFYCLVLLTGMVFLRAPKAREGTFSYTMLSVGQGDSGIVRSGPVTIGIDCGSSDRDDAGTLFTGACAYYGIRKIDVMTLSHTDLDHVNGLSDILNDPGIKVGVLWIPDLRETDIMFEKILKDAEAAGVPVKRMGAGDKMVSGETVIEVLSPAHGQDLSGNEGSLVLLIRNRSRSILFTGDISEETERSIQTNLQKTDILKVAHHGSRFSSGENFIRQTAPKLALVSYGRNNTYGHPSEDTIDRFRSEKIPVYGTGRSGAIESTFSVNCITLYFYGKRKEFDLPLNQASGH